MYLSKVFLHPGKLNNAYEWHRSLWTLFPNIERGNTAPFLYHVESLNLATGAHVLMQSSSPPIKRSVYAKVLAMKPFPIQFYAGQSLRYLVHANPTKCITDTHDKPRKKNNGKCRVPIIKEDEQFDWLRRKLADVAVIHVISIRDHAPTYFRKGSRVGKIAVSTFTGVLEVRDPDMMQDIRQKGIGSAKAFGCGLMLVKRLK